MTFILSFHPADAIKIFHDEVAVTAKADPSVLITGGVGTLDLILSTGTVLTQIATEVTSEARPARHRAVPGVVAKTFRDLCSLQHKMGICQ